MPGPAGGGGSTEVMLDEIARLTATGADGGSGVRRRTRSGGISATGRSGAGFAGAFLSVAGSRSARRGGSAGRDGTVGGLDDAGGLLPREPSASRPARAAKIRPSRIRRSPWAGRSSGAAGGPAGAGWTPAGRCATSGRAPARRRSPRLDRARAPLQRLTLEPAREVDLAAEHVLGERPRRGQFAGSEHHGVDLAHVDLGRSPRYSAGAALAGSPDERVDSPEEVRSSIAPHRLRGAGQQVADRVADEAAGRLFRSITASIARGGAGRSPAVRPGRSEMPAALGAAGRARRRA